MRVIKLTTQFSRMTASYFNRCIPSKKKLMKINWLLASKRGTELSKKSTLTVYENTEVLVHIT